MIVGLDKEGYFMKMLPVDKRKFDELFRTYCLTHGVKENFENFLTWLAQEKLINEDECIRYLYRKQRK